MPVIQNISRVALRDGLHIPATVLIQITDPCTEFQKSLNEFDNVHQFEFLDTELDREFCITPEQGSEIAEILKTAMHNNQDVLVQCNAGIYRSGGVAIAATLIGFEWFISSKLYNIRVFNKIADCLR